MAQTGDPSLPDDFAFIVPLEQIEYGVWASYYDIPIYPNPYSI